MEKKIVNKNWFGYITEDGKEVVTNPVAIFADKMLAQVEPSLFKVHNAILNSKVVMNAASKLLAGNIKAVLTLQHVTGHVVRLYSLEGRHLSRKGGDTVRSTWYTSPTTAVEIGEYMGGLTGKLVYVDLELDYCSDYSHRFYKRGDEAFILQGDLIKIAKNRRKYVKSSSVTEVAATK